MLQVVLGVAGVAHGVAGFERCCIRFCRLCYVWQVVLGFAYIKKSVWQGTVEAINGLSSFFFICLIFLSLLSFERKKRSDGNYA